MRTPMLNVEDIVFLWQIAIRADDDVCQYMMSQILESPVDLDDFHELPEEAES
ncbi:MAG: hypothetical protein WAR24_05735 [Candidatus Acidiferrales bacterium]